MTSRISERLFGPRVIWGTQTHTLPPSLISSHFYVLDNDRDVYIQLAYSPSTTRWGVPEPAQRIYLGGIREKGTVFHQAAVNCSPMVAGAEKYLLLAPGLKPCPVAVIEESGMRLFFEGDPLDAAHLTKVTDRDEIQRLQDSDHKEFPTVYDVLMSQETRSRFQELKDLVTFQFLQGMDAEEARWSEVALLAAHPVGVGGGLNVLKSVEAVPPFSLRGDRRTVVWIDNAIGQEAGTWENPCKDFLGSKLCQKGFRLAPYSRVAPALQHVSDHPDQIAMVIYAMMYLPDEFPDPEKSGYGLRGGVELHGSLREILPDVPFLLLTWAAGPDVMSGIQATPWLDGRARKEHLFPHELCAIVLDRLGERDYVKRAIEFEERYAP